MHDPLSRICQVRIPIPFRSKHRRDYRSSGWIDLFEIWHKDPCTDGSDDSCGRFMRARHGSEKVIEDSVKDLAFDWDRTYQTSPEEYADDLEEYGPHNNTVRFVGMFRPNGVPVMSTASIVLNIYFTVLSHHLGLKGKRADRKQILAYIQKHLASILFFAENPCDSLHSTITNVFGEGFNPRASNYAHQREQRIRGLVSAVYGDILRTTRPWWRSPNLHFHHWRIEVPVIRRLKRLLIDRCHLCRKHLGWGKSIASNWAGTQFTCYRCSGDCEAKKTP